MPPVLTLFCPSRGRPAAARELKESFAATSTIGSELVFLVDRDDPTLLDYLRLHDRSPEFAFTEAGEPTGDPTGPLNRAALACKADIVGFCGDDSRLETKGWDELVRVALKDPGFAWGSDGTSSKPWPSTIFVSKKIVDALGYLALPTLRRGFFDVAWLDLATRTNTMKVVPAMFRHDNSAGDPKSPNFKPEAQVPPEVIAQDERSYKEWLRGRMNDDVRKVRSVTELAHFFA